VRKISRHSQAVIASLLTGIVLLLNAMAASPSLHEWFHPDAGSPQHECVVTMFAHGQVDSACLDIPIPAPLTFVETIPAVAFSVFSPAIENLPAGRAPPVLPSVS
jgi:hypothetical protein